MKILFVCKHNRFRSKSGEALLDKYKKKRGTEVRSRGFKLDEYRYVSKSVKDILKEHGVKRVDNTPRQLTKKDMKWADKIIIDADNVSSKGFPKEKTEVWKIEDCDQSDYKNIRRIINKIEKRVKKLVKEGNL